MLVPNQKVEVRWNPQNIRWYEEKGYEYTKTGETFLCKAEDLMPTCKILVSVICNYCGDVFSTTNGNYNRAIKKDGTMSCSNPKCKSIKISNIEKKESFNKYIDFCKINNYTPLTNFENFKGLRGQVQYNCKRHGLQTSLLSSVLYNNAKCRECSWDNLSKERRKDLDELIFLINQKDCEILNPKDYINMNEKNLIIRHKKCGNVAITSLANFERSKYGCTSCSNQILSESKKFSYEYVKTIIESKNNNKLISKVYDGSNGLLKIECGSCGNPFKSSLSNYESHNLTGKCPDCNCNSYGEYLMSLILDKYKISYIRQKTFDECRDKKLMPFDFYLPDYNLCIEYDGEGHYEPCFGEDSYLKTLLHDSMKNWHCKWNNIDILHIPYWERNNLEKILIEKLNLPQIVDLKLSNGRIFKYKAHKPKE